MVETGNSFVSSEDMEIPKKPYVKKLPSVTCQFHSLIQ